MNVDYAIIIKNKTRLELLTERFNTKAQAKFYIERLGGVFKDYELEHEIFNVSLKSLQVQLSKVIKHKIIERAYISSFIFTENNIIIAIGQDGLVANVAKYAKGIPIIAVNPDEQRYDGVLLPFNTSNFIWGVNNVITHQYQAKTMQLAEVKLNDGQRLLAFNDLFIGPSSHTSARYKISFQGNIEEQSSSGLIVSTMAGSTGWLSSIFNMAYGVTGLFEKDIKPKRPELKSDELLFTVREPFKSITTQTKIIAGIIKNKDKLIIESLMPTRGIIFSDGVEADFLKFNSGTIATIGIAKETAEIVINENKDA